MCEISPYNVLCKVCAVTCVAQHEEIDEPCDRLTSYRQNQARMQNSRYRVPETRWDRDYNFASCGNYSPLQDFVPHPSDPRWKSCQNCKDAKKEAARVERNAKYTREAAAVRGQQIPGTTESFIHYQPFMPTRTQQAFTTSDLQSSLHATTYDTHPPSDASSYDGYLSMTDETRRASATSSAGASTSYTATSNDTQHTDMTGASDRTVRTDDGRGYSHAPLQNRLPSIHELIPELSHRSSNQAAYSDAHHPPSCTRDSLSTRQADEHRSQASIRDMHPRALQMGNGRFINPGEPGYHDPDAQPVRGGRWVTRGEEGWIDLDPPVGDIDDYDNSDIKREAEDDRRQRRRRLH